MALPYFYQEDLHTTHAVLTLDEATSKHCIQVLRMTKGEKLLLTNGKGDLLTVEISEEHKKKCVVTVTDRAQIPRQEPGSAIAMALLKNASRFEWFLEKATEMGINEIIPLLTQRTERQHFRLDRMKGILIAAMLQSQKAWLPVLHEPMNFGKAITLPFAVKLIAHCEPGEKTALRDIPASAENRIVFIGPEGDFSPEEINTAIEQGFSPISLGVHRLRAETAGVYAAAMLM